MSICLRERIAQKSVSLKAGLIGRLCRAQPRTHFNSGLKAPKSDFVFGKANELHTVVVLTVPVGNSLLSQVSVFLFS